MAHTFTPHVAQITSRKWEMDMSNTNIENKHLHWTEQDNKYLINILFNYQCLLNHEMIGIIS